MIIVDLVETPLSMLARIADLQREVSRLREIERDSFRVIVALVRERGGTALIEHHAMIIGPTSTEITTEREQHGIRITIRPPTADC